MVPEKLARAARAAAIERADHQDAEIEDMVCDAMTPICDQCLHAFELDEDALVEKCEECPAYAAVLRLAHQAKAYGTDRAVLAIAADLLNRGE